MNNSQVQGFGLAVNSVREEIYDFESMTNDLTLDSNVLEKADVEFSDEIVDSEKVVDMVIGNSIINETIRQMNQDKQRLKEIFNET